MPRCVNRFTDGGVDSMEIPRICQVAIYRNNTYPTDIIIWDAGSGMAIDVKTICLGVLSLGESSGYEIRKQFEEGPFSHFFDASYGAIYPALNALLADGLVTCVAVAQEKRPDKKVYALTEAGRRALAQALHQKPAADRIRSECLVTLFFAQLVDAAHARRVFDQYLDHLRAAHARVHCTEVGQAPPGRQFVHGFGLAIYGAAIQYMENNKASLFGADDREAAEPELIGAPEK